MTRLTDRRPIAVITGGAGGMGLATAKLLGRDHHVVLTDADAERIAAAERKLTTLGLTCDAITADVTDRPAMDDLAARVTSSGTLAAVVHTAGLSPRMGSAERILQVNALGTINVNEAFLPHAGPGTSIVNIASSAGHLPRGFPTPRRAYRLARTDPDRFLHRLTRRCTVAPHKLRPGIAYAISKNFVIWWSRHLTGELGHKGARITSVSPGSFDTEMGRLEKASGSGDLAAMSALQRHGDAEEIAEVLAFIAGSRPGYLTGTDLLVDGGAQAVMTIKDTIAMARQANRTDRE